ncbi:MAG: ferredoxin-type protein NapG [Rhodocyclaceae bacterium]|nr:ferredoxin-type protein NapG [Rhodocyclaceae bacterium]
MEAKPGSIARRQFIFDSAKMACGVGMFGLGLGLYAKQARALPPVAIRPPGAGAEADFLGACIRCGLCVRDCPPKILHLARPEESVATGTPWFLGRTDPCEMCEDIPCVKACPTGALDHALTDITQARMGLAVLTDHETCLNFLGLRCDVCYRVCPLIDKAITLEYQHNQRTGRHTMFLPTVHSDKCTGCGKCEKACVLDQAAIKVLPIKLAKGELGSHYRLGWEEKQKAGESLVAPDAEHQYNMPEGMKYENGKGLSGVPSGKAGSTVDSLSVPNPGKAAAPVEVPRNLPGGGLSNRMSDEAAR